MSKITVNKEVLLAKMRRDIKRNIFQWNLANYKQGMSLLQMKDASLTLHDVYEDVAILEDLELTTKLYQEVIEELIKEKEQEQGNEQ